MSSYDWMDRRGAPEGYDIAQICLNGHSITDCARAYPEHRQDHCQDCGAPTIMACKSCNTPIRGYYHGSMNAQITAVPKYCFKCGEPYPWQKGALENLAGILKEAGLSDQDVSEAVSTLPDVVHDTPKTELASLKLKRVLGKLGGSVYQIAVKVVTDVASETAKKTLGLG